MNKSNLFDGLVKNALDFLLKARAELDGEPKYSVIHFHAASELFLKARLMHEHWALVVSKRQDPDWEKFVSGDFQSVSLDEAAQRLDKVVQSGMSASSLAAFREISKHRNRMVHFFHEVHTEQESKELTRNVVRQQLKAWYFLHQLLTTQWRDVFEPWISKLEEIDAALRGLHEFLNVVFDDLRPKIEALEQQGWRFENCPSCGFKSKPYDEVMKSVFDSKCMVCGLAERCLRIECPSCFERLTFRNEGFATCDSCDEYVDPEALADILIDSGAAHIAAMEGDSFWGCGNCAHCDGYHTVVRTENEDWVCASCLGSWESLSHCEWCNEPNTGNMEHSYISGCNHCDGKAGWHKDD